MLVHGSYYSKYELAYIIKEKYNNISIKAVSKKIS